jgi:hypothetical protein
MPPSFYTKCSNYQAGIYTKEIGNLQKTYSDNDKKYGGGTDSFVYAIENLIATCEINAIP